MRANFFSHPLDKPVESMKKSAWGCKQPVRYNSSPDPKDKYQVSSERASPNHVYDGNISIILSPTGMKMLETLTHDRLSSTELHAG